MAEKLDIPDKTPDNLILLTGILEGFKALREAGHLQEAIKMGEEHLDVARERGFAEYVNQLAVTHRVAGQYRKALAFFEIAAQLSPDNSIERANILRDRALCMMEMERGGIRDNGYADILQILQASLDTLNGIPDNNRDKRFKGAHSATFAKLGLAMCLGGDPSGLNHIQTAIDIEKQEDVDVQSYFYYSFHIDKAVALFATEGSASEALRYLLTGIYGSRSMGHTQRAKNGFKILAYAVKTYGVEMVRSVLMEYKRGNRRMVAMSRGHRH